MLIQRFSKITVKVSERQQKSYITYEKYSKCSIQHVLLAIQNILQKSNILNRLPEILLFRVLTDHEKYCFSGCTPIQVSYFKLIESICKSKPMRYTFKRQVLKLIEVPMHRNF